MKLKNRIIYWVFTLLFVLPLGAGAIAFLVKAAPNVQGMKALGYPLYLLNFLGVAKILGVLTILIGRFPRLKEWAYAGFTFDLLGASYSHFCAGEGPRALFPLIMLAIMSVSYVQWRKLLGRKGV